MPRYNVHVQNTVSACVTVEANDPDQAEELAFDSDDMPGGITLGAFGSTSVDDGGWEAVEVVLID